MSTRTPRPAGGWNRLSVPPPGRTVPSGRTVSALTRACTATPRGARVQGQPAEASRHAVRDAQPELDQVQPGDLFGDRVLDLQPGVDLEEGDLVVLDQELGGGQAGVPAEPISAAAAAGQPGPDRVAHRRRGDLDQLLPAPLQAAVPVAEHRHGARAVADDLDLDVPGAGQQPLGVDPAVTEGRRRLGGAAAHGLGELGLGESVLAGHRPQARARRRRPPP